MSFDLFKVGVWVGLALLSLLIWAVILLAAVALGEALAVP